MRVLKLPFLERAVLLCEPDVCSEWPFATDSNGAAQVSIAGETQQAHRYVWQLVNGPIPEGSWVYHSCDNRACFNPHHLFLGIPNGGVKDPHLSYLEKSLPLCTPDACSEWPFPGNGHGYGRVTIEGQTGFTHRAAWELANGPIPPGLFVCHKCDNPPCFNPYHLFLGTSADNTRDMVNKGREPHGEGSSNARLTEAQVREIRRKYVKRSYGLRRLSAEYKVSRSNIHHIVSGKRWKHVDGYKLNRKYEEQL
jgi:hypothetical protein